jgi:hypothetical protein
MRYTAVFSGTQGPGGSVCPESGRLYYLFDVQDPNDKAIAGACQHIMDGLAGEPHLDEVLVGAFLPRSSYKDPWKQQKRENRAKRVPLFTYRLEV